MRLRNFEFGFPPPDLELLIDARLRGARAEFVQMLPPPGRDEDPADIFVDLAESDTAWREGLRAASTQLLLRWVGEFSRLTPIACRPWASCATWRRGSGIQRRCRICGR